MTDELPFKQCIQAVLLEKELSYLSRNNSIYSLEDVLKNDEDSLYPQAFVAALNARLLHHYFIPEEQGGRLTYFDEFVLIFRALFRRDPTLALGYGMTTFMASMVVWLFGSSAQKQQLATIIKRHAPVSVTFHEKAHGNDVLNSAFMAEQKDKCFQLNGEKWVINNAQESEAYVLFARTNPQGGSRGFSNFFVNKAEIQGGYLDYYPKIKTFGVRGCRIAGIKCNDLILPSTAIIGTLGHGFEQTIKSFQITKTVIAGVAIGAIDTYLRTCLSGVYPLSSSNPYQSWIKKTFTDSFIDILICDAVSLTMARALHVLPMEMSVYACVTKYFIATHLQETLKAIKKIAGFSALLRQGKTAILQKMERDFSVLNLGHASSDVCLSSIALQLKNLLLLRKNADDLSTKLRLIFDLHLELPRFDGNLLKINNQGKDSISSGSQQLITAWNHDKSNGLLSTALLDLINQVDAKYQQLTNEIRNLPENDAIGQRLLARRYVILLVAACVLQMWHFSKPNLPHFLQKEHWMICGLTRLFNQYFLCTSLDSHGSLDDCYNELISRHVNHCSFEIFSMLGGTAYAT